MILDPLAFLKRLVKGVCSFLWASGRGRWMGSWRFGEFGCQDFGIWEGSGLSWSS